MPPFDSLPDDVRSKLKTDPRYVSGNELLPTDVAATMYDHGRPLWTASQMQSELQTDHRQESVRDKLNTLDELDVCESMLADNGRIYWWDDPGSDRPVPPDVAVENQQHLTVAELFEPWYATVGVAGVLGPAVAGVPLLLGIFVLAGTVPSAIDGTAFLSAG